tara:strand:+ start:5282 stop:5395 length:114 start_codon:yes stop_codon:yes gene_type:complete
MLTDLWLRQAVCDVQLNAEIYDLNMLRMSFEALIISA